MRPSHTRRILAVLSLLVVGAATAIPAGAVEDGLMGARIGASYREVLRKFRQPNGMLVAAGGGMTYQSMPTLGATGLPQFGQASGGAGGSVPIWVEPIRVAFLADQQAEWVYDMRSTRGVALGIVFSGDGAEAVVTDVIVSGYPEYLKGKTPPVRTEKGVLLQSTFATVLEKYGFPPMMEVYAPGQAPAPAAGGRATGAAGRGGARGGGARGGGGMRGGGMRGGGMRGGGMRGGGMRGGGRRGAAPGAGPTLAQDPQSRFQVELTQMRGGGRRGGGGMRGGGGGRGGMRGGGRGGGGMRGGARGGVPPLGRSAANAAPASGLTAAATVNNQTVSLSRDCILSYEGIAFTLHDMRVMRIHVSE